MGFEAIKLKDIKLDGKDLPSGEYTFQVTPKSAKYHQTPWGAQQLSVRLTVVEGDKKGRSFFLQFDYPEFEADDTNDKTAKKEATRDRTAQDLKRLEAVLGVEQNDGEDIVDYFNRVAEDHAPKFSGKVQEAKPYTKNGVEKMGKARLASYSLKPAV